MDDPGLPQMDEAVILGAAARYLVMLPGDEVNRRLRLGFGPKISSDPTVWGAHDVGGEEKGDRMRAAFDATVLKQVESEVRNIKAEFRGVVPEESIDLVADESLQRLADSRVPQFVPLFVGRFTRQRLQELINSESHQS
jgi:hypothetical protein